MKTTILGVSFHNLLPDAACDLAFSFFESSTACTVFTPNPEMVMLARKDTDFKKILDSGDLVIPDGIGVVYASRLTKNKIPRRVAGIDLLTNLFERMGKNGNSVYFLGSAEGVAEAAAIKMKEQFPSLKIVGTSHGYFADEDSAPIIAKINEAKPDMLVVGLGFPRQEKWIFRHKHQLCAKILWGAGGSLDVLSGKIPRAPKIFQKLGIEWLFRLLRQPRRIWRQRVLVKFVFVVLVNKLRGKL